MLFKYSWTKFPEIEKSLIKIYENSKIKLEEENYDKSYAQEFINNIEEFLCCIISLNYNLSKVTKSLENLEYVSFQKKAYPKIFSNIISISTNNPPVINCKTKILLDYNLEGNERLNAKERRKMYLFHGLAHNVLNFQNDKTEKFSQIYNNVLSDTGYQEYAKDIVNSGWLLLEEAISQEIAEKFTYFITKKQRPKFNFNKESNETIINNDKILSNLEFCRMFQPIEINFGKVISKIGSIHDYSQEIIIYDLLKMSINGNFSENVINEYIYKNKELELYQMLYLMGILLNAEYSKYNLNIIPKFNTTKEENNKCFELLETLTDKSITLSRIDYPKGESKTIKENDIIKYKLLKLIKCKRIY